MAWAPNLRARARARHELRAVPSTGDPKAHGTKKTCHDQEGEGGPPRLPILHVIFTNMDNKIGGTEVGTWADPQ